MMNILNKIYVHPITYIVFLITFFTGQFKNYILFLFIIICHEMGHVLVSLYFKWNIKKIIILPFGGLTKYEEYLNRPLYEEGIISLAGFIFQFVFMLIFYNSFDKEYIYYNICIILFNLLPIIPLDGSKILNVILNKFFPYKKSHLISIYISFILLFMCLKSSLIMLISLSFLFITVLNELYNHNYLYNRFLLERYIRNIRFKKVRTVKSINDFFRDYKHVIKDNKFITEKEKLQKYFKR